MSLSNSSDGMVMPVSPMYNNGAGGMFGGDGWWVLLLFIILGGGNWGNGYGNGGNVPFIANDVQRGFDQATLTNGITNISNGLCNGFASVNQALCNGFAQAEIANNARQMADMNQNFGIQSALQNCCCENRASIADLKYTIATENCADRQAVSDALKDVIASNTANTQAILDKLCRQEIDALKAENASLQTQLNMATLRESQTAQNAFIAQGLNQEVDNLYNRLNNCPVPSTPVYGRTPIFTCNNNAGYGCPMAA